MSNNNETTLQSSNGQGNSLTKRETDVGFSLQPKNLAEALKVCEYLANSNLVPKQYKGNAGDILVCINWGQEVGLKPLQALSNIAVINGNPSMWGSAPLALVRNSPDFEFILEDNEAFAYARDKVNGWEHLKTKNPDDTSICVVKRKGEPPVVREFSKEDVETAKLGNVHKTYPKDMRKYRARSRALEAAFGDVLKGIRQAEIEKENEKMIEEGHYDDLTVRGEVQQPEERQTVDFDQDSNQQVQAEQETKPPAEPKPKPINREEVMAEITGKAKEVYGKEYYQKIKEHVITINSEASTMLDLSDDQLLALHDKVMSLEVQET